MQEVITASAQKGERMKSLNARERGSVLWVALVAIMIAMGIALSMLQTSVTNVKSQDQYTSQSNSFFATHGALKICKRPVETSPNGYSCNSAQDMYGCRVPRCNPYAALVS